MQVRTGTIAMLTGLILTLGAGFGAGGLAAQQAAPGCPTAPTTRLHIGTEDAPFVAVVAPGLGPLNMRALPAVSTGVELQLYGGNRVRVVGGPSCNGGYSWWRVENVNGRRGWIAEGNWTRYFLLPAHEYDRMAANPQARALTPTEASCPRWRPHRCPTAGDD